MAEPMSAKRLADIGDALDIVERPSIAHELLDEVRRQRAEVALLYAQLTMARVDNYSDTAKDFATLAQAMAVLYARQNGGYIARDGDLDDDGAGFDILWLTVNTPDGPRDVGFHLDDSGGLDDISSRRGERRVVPDTDRMLEILRSAVPVAGPAAGLSLIESRRLEYMVFGALHEHGPMTADALGLLFRTDVADLLQVLREDGTVAQVDGEPGVWRITTAGERRDPDETAEDQP